MTVCIAKARLTAAMLYAISQGEECAGNWFCHWCGSPCDDKIIHDDPPPIPFLRSTSTAKRPAEPYICRGCWLWRRSRVSINFLAGRHKIIEKDQESWRAGFRDGQSAKDHSWLITDKVALAIESEQDKEEIWRFLIGPTKKFVLMLKERGKIENLLQLAIANDLGGILAETPLHFTFNNIPHQFSLYEIIESLKNRNSQSGPGVAALWRFLGAPPEDVRKKYPVRKVEQRGRGRPVADETKLDATQEVIVDSGEQR